MIKAIHKEIQFYPRNSQFIRVNKNIYYIYTQLFATKLVGGTTNSNKDSHSKRLGIKKFGGEEVLENVILARQRGFKWRKGENVNAGKDHTLHSKTEVIYIYIYIYIHREL